MSLSKLVMSSLTGTLKALTTRITILYFLEERLDFIFFLSFLCGFNCLLGIKSSKKVDFKALIKMKEKNKAYRSTTNYLIFGIYSETTISERRGGTFSELMFASTLSLILKK